MRVRVAAIWMLCACATASPTPDAPIIDDLKIEGTHELSDGALKKKILTTEKGLLPTWLPGTGEPPRFDANAWQADLRRIERYYQAHGYYQAKVVDEEVDETRPGHVALKVRVIEGEPTHLRKLVLNGLEGLPADQRETVTAKLPLTPGAIFLEDDWTQVKPLLINRLHELGYVEASVTGEAHVDVKSRTADVELDVTPAPRYRVGKTFVATSANPKVSVSTIVDWVTEAVKPGDWYSESALTEAQARLIKTGIFAAAKVYHGAPDHETLLVPIVVDVRESPFHTLRGGGGVGIDQTRNEARGSWEYTDRNFGGGLRRYTFRGKAGYAFLPNVVASLSGAPGESHGVFADVINEFEQPRFLRPDLNFAASLELQRGLDPAFTWAGGELKTGLIWRPTSNIAFFPSYNLDVYFLTAAAPLGGTVPPVLFGCGTTCVLTYLEQTLEIDHRDDKNEPTRGWYASVSLQEGTGLDPVPYYLRAMPDVRKYVSAGNFTLSGRLRAGTLLPLSSGASPIVVRFYAGGGSSMRGFNSRRLSPLVLAPDGSTLPIGGDGLLEASLELRYRLTEDIVLATFADSGFVTPGPFPTDPRVALASLYAAVGVGARYHTPLGPVRVDVAYRLPIGPPLPVTPLAGAPAAPVSAGYCFGLGTLPPGAPGAPEGLCTFHLTIGEAF